MSTASTRLLALAHHCLSWALQFDYLSNGAGRQRNAAGLSYVAPRATTGKAAAAQESKTSHSARPRRGDIVSQYLAEIATRRRLSSSEEYRLACAARRGDSRARRQLIEHQLRLVVIMARRYRSGGLPLLDLIEEGNIGLLTAIEKFDPEMGYRFSTYAKWWIRQSIELALMTQTRVVHVPVHVTRALKRRAKTELSTQAAPSTGLNFLLYDVSQQADGGTGEAVIDGVPAPEDDQPEQHLHYASQRREIESALFALNDKERLVIRLRYGLSDDTPMTLASIAARLALSSERVRQIQSEALTKLRSRLRAEIMYM